MTEIMSIAPLPVPVSSQKAAHSSPTHLYSERDLTPWPPSPRRPWPLTSTVAWCAPTPCGKFQRFLDWAATIGPQTQAAIEQVLASRVHPQQGYRTALGILRLGQTHGEERLEAACLRAIQIKAVTYRSIASILKHALERQTPAQVQANLPLDHANVRGSKYYH